MASIPEFLQESYKGLQEALEDKYKDLLLEHEKNISYRLSEEDYTLNYGDVIIEGLKESHHDIELIKGIQNIHIGRWIILCKKLNRGSFGEYQIFLIDNHGESYNFELKPGYGVDVPFLLKSVKINKDKYKYCLSNQIIKMIKLLPDDKILNNFGQINNLIIDILKSYQKQAEYEYNLIISQKENKRLQELLDQQSQKAEKAVTTESSKNLFQRFQEKIKTF